MRLRLVLRGVVAFCLEVCVFHGLVTGTTTGFSSLDTIHNPDMATRMFRTRDQWLFPSMVFACTGNITKWTFRAIDSQQFINGLPELQVWRRQGSSPNPDDYELVASSGSEAELQGEEPVYEYVLQPPIEVQEGDIFGVFLADQGTERIFVAYLDLGEGNASNSYWINPPHKARFITNLTAGTLDQRFMPLVTAEIIPDKTEDQPNIVAIVVPVAVVASLASAVVLVMVIVTLILFARYKKQKTLAASEQQQAVVPKNEEQFKMVKNDAYTAVIATEQNEAYMTNPDSIPAAQNEAYGVTQLEGGNSGTYYVVNQLAYDEPQRQPVQMVQGGVEDSYDYVRECTNYSVHD